MDNRTTNERLDEIEKLLNCILHHMTEDGTIIEGIQMKKTEYNAIGVKKFYA